MSPTSARISLLVCGLVAITPAASTQARSRDDREDSLRARYGPQLRQGPFLRDTAWIRDSVRVDSIMLRRNSCFGRCPEYSVVLYRNGHARFSGGEYAPRKGEWAGRFRLYEFVRLAYLAEYLRFTTLDSAYESPVKDLPGAWVTIGWRNARGAQTVYDYGFYGPPRLWALEQAIDAVSNSIEWQPQ